MNIYDIKTTIGLFFSTILGLLLTMLPYALMYAFFYSIDRFIGEWVNWILLSILITSIVIWEFKSRYEKEKKENNWFKSR